jgi:hypothetical protein
MHDYRKFKVSVNVRIGRTARLCERLRRCVTSNPASPANAAAGNAYNVADTASLLQALRNAGANSVVILGVWRIRATSRSVHTTIWAAWPFGCARSKNAKGAQCPFAGAS